MQQIRDGKREEDETGREALRGVSDALCDFDVSEIRRERESERKKEKLEHHSIQ